MIKINATSCLTGLDSDAVAQRLAQDGFNELPATTTRTVLTILLDVLREPMFLLLLCAGVIYLLLGDPMDALMLLGFVLLSMSITIFQQRRSERVLATLHELASPRALVIRDGQQVRIPGREVVPGDLLLLEEGDRVAADAVLLESHDLLIDESMLSGESMAVAKRAAFDSDVPSEEGVERVFAGTMITGGGGMARVLATGAQTELGKIGKRLQSIVPEDSPLQRELAHLLKIVAWLACCIALLVLLITGWMRGDWLNGLLSGITVAMSLLPEEFTLIMTVFMALGAWRIAGDHVLTRHMPVIEALGSATVLCVDKTGTLTQNRMAVKALALDGVLLTVEKLTTQAAARRLLHIAALASEIIPFDRMEQAILHCQATLFSADRAAAAQWTLVHDYPLTHGLPVMTHVWSSPEQTDYLIALKGAPETVLDLCGIGGEQRIGLLQQVDTLAARGMRVLAVAEARQSHDEWPGTPAGFGFSWLGLLALADPVRPEVPAAVAQCRRAGIRVVMITGDYAVTAHTIAGEAGLQEGPVISGSDIARMDAQALRQAVHHTNVFARIRPEQKLDLVNALKANGEVVAMTGDGVNDAPALRAAHIGISMGQRGTDVAREASSLVLLTDDFQAIVKTIQLGRRIFDNLRKALTYVVAVHMPIAGMALLPLLLGYPVAFMPIHIVFFEMIINPACSIVFETEAADPDIMLRAPRRIDEALFGRYNVGIALLQGAGLLTAIALVFFISLHSGLLPAAARTLAFTTFVIGNLLLIIGNRSVKQSLFALLRRPNQAQWWVIGITLVGWLAALKVPVLQRAFHFMPVVTVDLLLAVAAGLAATVWFELVKIIFRQKAST